MLVPSCVCGFHVMRRSQSQDTLSVGTASVGSRTAMELDDLEADLFSNQLCNTRALTPLLDSASTNPFFAASPGSEQLFDTPCRSTTTSMTKSETPRGPIASSHEPGPDTKPSPSPCQSRALSTTDIEARRTTQPSPACLQPIKARAEHPFQHLPTAVAAIIAEFLCLPDRARLAATCSATWHALHDPEAALTLHLGNTFAGTARPSQQALFGVAALFGGRASSISAAHCSWLRSGTLLRMIRTQKPQPPIPERHAGTATRKETPAEEPEVHGCATGTRWGQSVPSIEEYIRGFVEAVGHGSPTDTPGAPTASVRDGSPDTSPGSSGLPVVLDPALWDHSESFGPSDALLRVWAGETESMTPHAAQADAATMVALRQSFNAIALTAHFTQRYSVLYAGVTLRQVLFDGSEGSSSQQQAVTGSAAVTAQRFADIRTNRFQDQSTITTVAESTSTTQSAGCQSRLQDWADAPDGALDAETHYRSSRSGSCTPLDGAARRRTGPPCSAWLSPVESARMHRHLLRLARSYAQADARIITRRSSLLQALPEDVAFTFPVCYAELYGDLYYTILMRVLRGLYFFGHHAVSPSTAEAGRTDSIPLTLVHHFVNKRYLLVPQISLLALNRDDSHNEPLARALAMLQGRPTGLAPGECSEAANEVPDESMKGSVGGLADVTDAATAGSATTTPWPGPPERNGLGGDGAGITDGEPSIEDTEFWLSAGVRRPRAWITLADHFTMVGFATGVGMVTSVSQISLQQPSEPAEQGGSLRPGPLLLPEDFMSPTADAELEESVFLMAQWRRRASMPLSRDAPPEMAPAMGYWLPQSLDAPRCLGACESRESVRM